MTRLDPIVPSNDPPGWTPAAPVREAYEFFDTRRARNEPIDEGDVQNLHIWMRRVTEWIERESAR